MNYGFCLFLDEAGDEGIERVRPVDPNGGTEYFVLAGFLIRSERRHYVVSHLNRIKLLLGISADDTLHFRDLTHDQKVMVIKELCDLEICILAIVSNKRNMVGYRNTRVEERHFTIVRDRRRPENYNFFYNNLLRYALERASEACAKRSATLNRKFSPIEVVLEYRKNFRYSQTKAYLGKLKVSHRSRSYFNNKRTIDWRVVDPSSVFGRRCKEEPCLEIADCIASAIYAAIDEDQLKSVEPLFLEIMAKKFYRVGRRIKDNGFKLLPEPFDVPVSDQQRRSLSYVGYSLPSKNSAFQVKKTQSFSPSHVR